MASLNKVFLIGNLTRDPELRYTPSGLAVTTFTIAANRSYTTKTGEKKEDVTFMRVVTWGKRAEICAEYLNKGSLVFAEGRLQNRQWQAQDGTQRNTVEVVANNIQFLGTPKGSRVAAAGKSAPQNSQQAPDMEPPVDLPHEKGKVDEDVFEDEVPF
ncbi:MAG: single-stranded DNA-binding protein [Candidatus Omnitrophota bacterium]